MSAPWSGELSVRDGAWDIVGDDGASVAVVRSDEDATALVHRANAYPKLVEALEDIAHMTPAKRGWAFDPVAIAREALAAIQEEDDE